MCGSSTACLHTPQGAGRLRYASPEVRGMDTWAQLWPTCMSPSTCRREDSALSAQGGSRQSLSAGTSTSRPCMCERLKCFQAMGARRVGLGEEALAGGGRGTLRSALQVEKRRRGELWGVGHGRGCGCPGVSGAGVATWRGRKRLGRWSGSTQGLKAC